MTRPRVWAFYRRITSPRGSASISTECAACWHTQSSVDPRQWPSYGYRLPNYAPPGVGTSPEPAPAADAGGKELETENARLKKLVANQALDIDMLREVAKGEFRHPESHAQRRERAGRSTTNGYDTCGVTKACVCHRGNASSRCVGSARRSG